MKRKVIWTSILTIGICLSAVMFISTGDGQTTELHVMEIYGDKDDNTPREDKAEVVIKAPDKVKVGDMIIVDLSESLGGGFDYAVEPTPPGLRTFNKGKIIVCGTGDKNVTYTFSVSCALAGDSDIGIHKIKVTGAQAPGPPVNPGQNIIEKVKDWASEIESPTLRDDAIKLAQSFSSVSIIIEQGTFESTKALITATATSNRDAVSGNLEHWTPLLDSLMRELKAMAQLGILSDVTDHARIWKEVAQGLREFADKL